MGQKRKQVFFFSNFFHKYFIQICTQTRGLKWLNGLTVCPGHAEFFLHFVWKKSTFYSGRWVDLPPDVNNNMSLISRVFSTLPIQDSKLAFNCIISVLVSTIITLPNYSMSALNDESLAGASSPLLIDEIKRAWLFFTTLVFESMWHKKEIMFFFWSFKPHS